MRISRRSQYLLAVSILLVTITAGCAGRRPLPTLPAEAELEPNRLMLFVHGYMADHERLSPMVDVFTRRGVDRGGEEPVRVHSHVFDYGRFTKAGAGHNQPMEDLVSNFSDFYHSLPDRCPVCRRRATQPVEVTIVAHSMGGVMIRDFLLDEAQRIDPGEHEWEIARVVTMGSPFFGSSMTRLTQGFLSIIVNGIVRTVVLGFVRPERGGTFGNTLDPQARAVRVGSPYLWDSHAKWIRHLERHRDSTPPWLHVVAIGAVGARGDGVSRISSTNIAPLLPEGSMETMLVDFRHGSLLRIKERGRRGREQRVLIRAISSFMEFGTLANDAVFQRRFVPEVGQSIFVQSEPDDDDARADLQRKLARLDRAIGADIADVWMRFYEVAPDPVDGGGPRAILLEAPQSFFRTGEERSPYWLDLESIPELSADGELVPVVASLDFQSSQIVSIPEITPTGEYRMHIRLAKGVVLGSEHVRLVIEGVGGDEEFAPDELPGIPFHVRPLRANLIHVMLDGPAIREAYPKLDSLDIVEVGLVAEH